MKIVIDIDEEQYKFIKQSMTIDKVKDYPALLFDICEHITNGTPLPEGHGDIVDIEKVVDMFWDGNSMEITKYDLSIIEPIIKADRKGE